MEGILIAIVLAAGLAAGGFVGYYFRKLSAARQVDSAERKAEEVLNKSKEKQAEILLDAKEKAIKLIDEAKLEAEERRQEVKALQTRVEKREAVLTASYWNLKTSSFASRETSRRHPALVRLRSSRATATF